MKMRSAVALLALASVLVTAAADADADTWRFNRWIPATHFLHTQWLDVWAEDVGKVTDGRVKVQFTASSLAPPPRQFQLVTDGIADIAWHTHAYSPGVFPVSEIGALPGLGDSVEAISVAYWRVYHKYLDVAGEHEGVKILGMNVTPPGHVYNSKRPITSVADFEGLKIRSTNSNVTEALEAFGATPILAPVGQIRDGLARGVMDGTTFTDDALFTFHVADLLKYATKFPGGIYNQTFAIIVNPKKWQAISAKDREAIMKISGEEMGRRLGEVWDPINAEGTKKLKAAGIEITHVEGEFLERVRPILAQFEKRWVEEAKKKGVEAEAALAYFKAEIANYKK